MQNLKALVPVWLQNSKLLRSRGYIPQISQESLMRIPFRHPRAAWPSRAAKNGKDGGIGLVKGPQLLLRSAGGFALLRISQGYPQPCDRILRLEHFIGTVLRTPNPVAQKRFENTLWLRLAVFLPPNPLSPLSRIESWTPLGCSGLVKAKKDMKRTDPPKPRPERVGTRRGGT